MNDRDSQAFHEAVHILNGDSLHSMLRALEPNADYLVLREALIEGAVCDDSLQHFLQLRSNEISRLYGVSAEEYQQKTGDELRAVMSIPAGRPVWLWFENDAFCQTNLWFLSTLFSADRAQHLWRIFPTRERSGWKTFNLQNSDDLQQCLDSRMPYTTDDLLCSHTLWTAYCHNDLDTISSTQAHTPELFQHRDTLAEILEFRLHNELRDSALVQKISRLNHAGDDTFSRCFWEFHSLYPEYGFGDLQFKRAWDAMKKLDATN